MALVLKDRVKETTTTTGTGTYTLAGAVTGFEAFSSVGNSNTTYYSCTDGTDFEVGIGTYTSSGTTLARTTILQSSNSDSAVSWSSGTKTIFCAQPAEKAVFLNASDNIELADDEKIVLGTGGDLEIYHDGSHSYIQDTGTGNIRLPTSRFQIRNAANNATMLNALAGGKVALFNDGNEKLETTSGGINVTGEIAATSLDISGDVDVDGTLEADAMTLNGTAITTTATLSTGISNNNVPKFTSGVADDDFLRVNGTDIEGRSAAEVLSDIGGQASLTFGISNTNAVKIDSTSVADDEYARFTANGLESRATSEVLSDIGAQASLTFGISNTNAVKIDSTSVADDEFARFTANGLESRSASEVRSDIGLGTAAVAATGISNTNVPVFTSGAADNDFLRIDGTSIEGRSASEVLSDIGATTAALAADEATALAIALG